MITMFLANVLGCYFIIIGLLFLFRTANVQTAVNDILAQPGLFFFIALFSVIIGLMMVISHNVWVTGWAFMITLIAWLTLISGLIRLFLPDFARKMAHSFIHDVNKIRIAGIIVLIIGVVLLYDVYSINFLENWH